MVEAFAVASGKGGTGKTTSTLALGMALATEYDVTVVDADMGMANLLFHAGLADVDTTLHDVLVEGGVKEEVRHPHVGVDDCHVALLGERHPQCQRARGLARPPFAAGDRERFDHLAEVVRPTIKRFGRRQVLVVFLILPAVSL